MGYKYDYKKWWITKYRMDGGVVGGKVGGKFGIHQCKIMYIQIMIGVAFSVLRCKLIVTSGIVFWEYQSVLVVVIQSIEFSREQ